MRISSLGLSLVLAAAVPVSAATTRVLRAELPAGPAAVAVENLAGSMKIVEGAGDRIVVEATIHADSAALADAFRLDRESDGASLRVRYPLDRVGTVRYPDPRRRHDSWWEGLGFGEGSTVDYDGRRVRVADRHGTVLYADLEIRVPRSPVHATFRNLVGFIDASHASGNLDFAVRSADLRLSELDGNIHVDGTSGDIEASNIHGSWKSTFTSGDCRVEGFRGDSFEFEATSGDLVARDIEAGRFASEATSGDIRLSNSKIGEFSAEATSGDIALEARGTRLTKVHVRTTSGDVSLRLPYDASFDAGVTHGSGDVNVEFDEAVVQGSGRHTERFRRGNGGIQIDARTGSGDLTISPAG